MFTNKNVLVTGGTGMIGSYLVQMLRDKGAKVRVASLENPINHISGVSYCKVDLSYFDRCLDLCEGMNYVFHLAGTKGSPFASQNNPASFFVPTIMCNTNIIEASRKSNVDWLVYTSSMGVYGNSSIFNEEDVWKAMPSKNDWFPGWAKRMGELQIDSYKIQYNWNKASIIRPGNVYGIGDSFEKDTAMVIPSLIRRINDEENPLRVFGKNNRRDFVHASDVARQMIFCVENKITSPLNAASGESTTIEKLVDIIIKCSDMKDIEVIWEDKETALSDNARILSMVQANRLGFYSKIKLEEGIKDTVEWYKSNKDKVHIRYNPFN